MQAAIKYIEIPEAPPIPGLTFRSFQGEVDYPVMLALINSAKVADQEERSHTLEDIARNYSHLTNCDPYRDILIAEVNGAPACYSRLTWRTEQAGESYIYSSLAFMAPEWRRKGIGRAILAHNQRRLREIASEHPRENAKFFQASCNHHEEGALALLQNDGYVVIRQFMDMVRPDLENIPDLPLPQGIEIRPARPEHFQKIWDACCEAFSDHWGFTSVQEEDYRNWQESPQFQPDLWQIAWDGDEVAGMILNFINHAENQEYGRKRGYTEDIAVRRPWRRRGLARALLARSLKMHRGLGMQQAALGVDSQSLSGANLLYESMGFRMVKIYNTLRKPMDEV
jgi:mycothiol synthase